MRNSSPTDRECSLSDISNEPDDAESLVRYLLYANQFQTKGLVACTSIWMKYQVCPQDMEKIVRAYAQVVVNLSSHVHPHCPYPSAESLLNMIKTGPSLYGKEASSPEVPPSDGAKLLIERLDESEEPLWVLCWGGTNVLAQALDRTRHRSDSAKLRSKIQAYAISDQDDTGLWIRLQFPDIFYINSVHGWNQYGQATWTGISGDRYYGFDVGGPDFSKLTKEWFKENIQIGPFGSVYPDYLFIPEGDSPTFLYLIQNGLGQPDHPEWGSWGGRYTLCDLSLAGRHYHNTVDRVIGMDGKLYCSNHATIWRWRDEYQNDFAAKMQWTLDGEFKTANHAPVAIVNGPEGPSPLVLEVEAGEELTLDTGGTYDPDGDALTFKWFQYKDVSATQWWIDAEIMDVEFKKQDNDGRVVKVRLPPPEKCAVDMSSRKPIKRGQVLHFVLEVKDDGVPSLTTYRRVVVHIANEDLRAGPGGAERIANVIHE